MSELRPRNPIERDAEEAFHSGKGIDANPHQIGTESHTAWEQAYLQLANHFQIAA